MPHLIPLNDNWTFANVDDTEAVWLPASKVPTSVHVELIRLGGIPDPFIGMNEWEVQWVGEATWAFKASFHVNDAVLAEPNIDLVFEGLDTYANIELNGHQIGDAKNAFVTYRIPVKEHLQSGANDLLLTFPSTFLKGRELERENGKFGLWNGDSSRLHVRAPGYTYGWDWGPVLRTVGPWRPISLHSYPARLSDVRVNSDVSEALDTKLTVDLALSHDVPATASVVLKDPSGKVVKNAETKFSGKTAKLEWEAKAGELELWWPVGYGKQPQYTVEVQVADETGKALDAKTEKIGIRRARVVQDPLEDQEGRTFLFEINNVRIFCGGSNWIPADSFLTTITPERYRAWLKLLVDGNQNMARVWGGGIYEADVFYDTCDELGILVWQDFMFGCGQYPAYDEYLGRVQIEAEQNVARLRHHPSIVIFAGNNEDYQLAESLGLEMDYSAPESPSDDYTKTNFPARHIYERLLPEVVDRLSNIFYHRGSPYSGFGKDTRDRHYGDLHQWNVWHGTQEPWHNWDILSGRFVSEFGMQGYPDIRTVDHWLDGNKAERYPQSRTMNQHNKADGFERRLELYLVENFKHSFDLESYVYYTQVMQAETLASAYRLWRRNWQGKGREYTAGALVWQINDCWPVTSWAIVDYFLRPKPAYFTIKRELATFTVGMTRKFTKIPLESKPHSAVYFEIDSQLEIWATNSTLEEKEVTLVLNAWDIDNPSWTWSWDGSDLSTPASSNMIGRKVKLGPNKSTEIWSGRVPGQPVRSKESERPKNIVVQARLLDSDGKVIARYANWPEPFKFIHFPEVPKLGFRLDVAPGSASEGDDASIVMMRTDVPIKGVVLDVVDPSAGGRDLRWSDQAIDLCPGDEQTVTVWGLDGRGVHARFLGDGSA
jgi:beta-mannosidase